MDSYTCNNQCWPTRKTLYSLALFRHWMQSGGLTKNNDQWEWMERKSQIWLVFSQFLYPLISWFYPIRIVLWLFTVLMVQFVWLLLLSNCAASKRERQRQRQMILREMWAGFTRESITSVMPRTTLFEGFFFTPLQRIQSVYSKPCW